VLVQVDPRAAGGQRSMRHLVLVRHGESELNAANRLRRIYCGQIETPLTDVGRRQAVAAARQLARLEYLRLSQAISSPLERARETLQLMLAELNGPIELLSASPHLLERSHGAFEGREEHEVFGEYPHYRDDPNFNGFMNHFEQCAPDGENLATVTARAWPVIREVVQASSGDVLVVSHYNTIRCIVGKALELSPDVVLRMRPQNAAPIVLRYNGGYKLLEGGGILEGA
jgi:broad specificity phosphatase PhoE